MLCSWKVLHNTDKETKTHPPPSITARLGNSSKLNASSEVIANSYKVKKGKKGEKKGKKKMCKQDWYHTSQFTSTKAMTEGSQAPQGLTL